jgi:hypothetical protein
LLVSGHSAILSSLGRRAARLPIWHQLNLIPDFPADDPEPQNSVACAQDGECFNSGCGYACLSTRDRHTLWLDCVAFPDEARRLRDHYCGCIDGSCRWFTQ